MSGIIAFLQAHAAVVSGLVVAILDFAFAVSPGLEGNGILHSIYLWVSGLAGKAPPSAPV